VPTLEASTHAYADSKAGAVVNPALGTGFDLVEEGYLAKCSFQMFRRVNHCNLIAAQRCVAAMQ